MAGANSQTRGHAGHSHHHHHDTTYLTSANKADPGVKITRVGLYVNLGMAIAKGAGGYVFNSSALTADALHALTDLVSDITTLATISYSLKPPSPRFPSGYGKIESLGALAVSTLLLSGGVMIGLQALAALSLHLYPDLAHLLHHLPLHSHSHSHSGGDADMGPNINAAWLAGGSIVIKEWLYRATIKVAREKRSSVLASNAYHHRVDSLTAFVALATICASRVFASAGWLDPVGGLVISGMIVQAGWGNSKAAVLELADVGMDGEVGGAVEGCVRGVLMEVEGGEAVLRGVRGVKSGQNFLVEVEVGVPGGWRVERLGEVEQRLRERVAAEVRGVRRVGVRFTAGGEGEPFADQFVKGRAGDAEEVNEHEREHEHSNGHTTAKASEKTK